MGKYAEGAEMWLSGLAMMHKGFDEMMRGGDIKDMDSEDKKAHETMKKNDSELNKEMKLIFEKNHKV